MSYINSNSGNKASSINHIASHKKTGQIEFKSQSAHDGIRLICPECGFFATHIQPGESDNVRCPFCSQEMLEANYFRAARMDEPGSLNTIDYFSNGVR